MKTIVIETKQCPQCGRPLLAASLEGLCPACLLAQGTDTKEGPASPKFQPPPLEQIRALFPQLEIMALLGAGGMGAVYKARQPTLDRIVALKILPAASTGEINFTERFNREARALARLSHPNIVALYEFGQVDGLHHFIMEFVDGANLRQLEQAGRLSPREALQIIPQICDALQYAHDEGVVHRDIKPENVLIDRKGRVKIADFGLAKIAGREGESMRLTAEGQVMGTPHYMAPEQLERPLSVDHRADIYSLGVVFYEMLTGDLPLGKFSAPSRKVELDVRLDEVVLRALENDPGRRYQKASEVKSRLETINGTSPPATNEHVEEPTRPSAPKRPWWRSPKLATAIACGFAWLYVQDKWLMPHLRRSTPAPPAARAVPLKEASQELWSPPADAAERAKPAAVLAEAKELMQRGDFEGALQRHIWFHNHAVSLDPALSAVRRSFALSDWKELAQRYPKARLALIEIRDEKTTEIDRGSGFPDLFADVAAINSYLDDDKATCALFHRIEQTDPVLARQSIPYAKAALVKNGEYDEKTLTLLHPPAVPQARKAAPEPREDVPINDPGLQEVTDQPAVLRFVAWQDEWKTAGERAARYPNGSAVTNTNDLALLHAVQPSGLDVSNTEAGKSNPRIVHLWFSHPLFDQQSWNEVTLLDETGAELKLAAGGSLSSGSHPADAAGGGVGWITSTFSPGDGNMIPRAVTVRLRYVIGALEKKSRVAPDYNGSMSLQNGSQLSSIGQTAAGRSVVAIAVNVKGREKEKFGVIAIDRFGKSMNPAGTSISRNAGSSVSAERFEFESPLSGIDHFEIGVRPIRTMEWNNVILIPQ